jgi:hypothetical protein
MDNSQRFAQLAEASESIYISRQEKKEIINEAYSLVREAVPIAAIPIENMMVSESIPFGYEDEPVILYPLEDTTDMEMETSIHEIYDNYETIALDPLELNGNSDDERPPDSEPEQPVNVRETSNETVVRNEAVQHTTDEVTQRYWDKLTTRLGEKVPFMPSILGDPFADFYEQPPAESTPIRKPYKEQVPKRIHKKYTFESYDGRQKVSSDTEVLKLMKTFEQHILPKDVKSDTVKDLVNRLIYLQLKNNASNSMMTDIIGLLHELHPDLNFPESYLVTRVPEITVSKYQTIEKYALHAEVHPIEYAICAYEECQETMVRVFEDRDSKYHQCPRCLGPYFDMKGAPLRK